ncbi:MAG TPA: ergothioneine biosynthesis protein EgtB, partial [Rhodanobacteraceae bacterium]|nr:ergothioneine biosynthesis protein EgtB [Rhodanobacteraceae bacterium]
MPALSLPSGGRLESGLATDYAHVRDGTASLCAPLAPEDTVAQSMADASPAKWHLAHTTWFFEQFVLAHFVPGYRRFREGWDYLFNSYYQTVGPMHARPRRGLLTRPTLDEVRDYRTHVDGAMRQLLAERDDDPELRARVTLGLNHEQQHQELLLTDIQHLFSMNPLQPVYRESPPVSASAAVDLRFVAGCHGIVEIGHAGEGFAYDNEGPRHREWLHPHAIANRCVTNGEFRAFIDDGGYRNPVLWLSEGWDTVCREDWKHPLYWDDDLETTFTLAGRRHIDPAAPVCHIGFFEADAFARWAGARLPTEAEWEIFADGLA